MPLTIHRHACLRTASAYRVGRLGWCAFLVMVLTAYAAEVGAQGQPQSGVALAVSQATPGEPAVLRFQNRPITVLRANVFSRPPAERAAAAVNILNSIVGSGTVGPVSTRFVEGATLLTVGTRDVFGIVPLDVDALAGETQEAKAAEAVARLRQALDEAIELRTPRRMLISTGLAMLGTLVAGLLLWLMVRLYRVLAARALSDAERRLQKLSHVDAQLVKASRASDVVKHAVRALFAAGTLFLIYAWLTFVLRRFPYTRPWGESLRAFLFERLGDLGLGIASAMPEVFTVLVIFAITRFAVRMASLVFQAAEEGRVTIPYVYAETAQPTRRLVTALIWLLGLVLAYPYLPGSDSDAFKGVSVFVGLVLSLGSSGIVNQMMSGLTLTYSRALRVGDFVKIGDVEGTVTHVGALSTKVKTPRGEEMTLPNAVVISQVTTNYSRFAATEGVYVPTSLTIGYDTPWRQVHALLLLAAERTPGVRQQPKPVVRQSALQDFYVTYTLMVCLEQPNQRAAILDALHANIQDAFNEYGVQIMSPNYEADPNDRKVVRKDQWYAAPAKSSAAIEGT
jgi:small-conductance mechanosensitive channel